MSIVLSHVFILILLIFSYGSLQQDLPRPRDPPMVESSTITLPLDNTNDLPSNDFSNFETNFSNKGDILSSLDSTNLPPNPSTFDPMSSNAHNWPRRLMPSNLPGHTNNEYPSVNNVPVYDQSSSIIINNNRQMNKIWIADNLNFPFVVMFKFKSKELMFNQVSHQVSNTFHLPLCAGSIINSRWLLTSGNCARRFANQSNPSISNDVNMHQRPQVVALLGSYRNISFTPLPFYELENIIYHPQFDERSLSNNLALIRTRKPMNIRRDWDTRFDWNQLMNAEQLYETVLMTRMKVMFTYLLNGRPVDIQTCGQIYGNQARINLPVNSICYEPRVPIIRFQRDLVGGPLVKLQYGRIPVPLGVLSFGLNGQFPIVYTSLQPYYQWVQTVTSRM